MKMIKKVAFVCVFLITGFTGSSSAESIILDPELVDTINSMIAEVKKSTISQLYQQAPQQDQMRTEMQKKYASNGYLQDVFMARQRSRTMAMFHAGVFVRKRMNEKPIPLLDPQEK